MYFVAYREGSGEVWRLKKTESGVYIKKLKPVTAVAG